MPEWTAPPYHAAGKLYLFFTFSLPKFEIGVVKVLKCGRAEAHQETKGVCGHILRNSLPFFTNFYRLPAF